MASDLARWPLPRKPQPAADTDALLRQILEELGGLRAVVDALAVRPLSDSATRNFLSAVFREWGDGAFLSGELLAWARDPGFAARQRVLDAARALLGLPVGVPVTAHALGLRLGAIAGTEADGLKLERMQAHERGSRLWRVCGVDPSQSPSVDSDGLRDRR